MQKSPPINLAIVPGDGVGPEVCEAAVTVLEAVLDDGERLEINYHSGGAGAYLEHGAALPDTTLEACRAADAVLHGAAGLPDVLFDDGTEAGQDFSMKIRSDLDLYANIRPIKLYSGLSSPLAGVLPGDIDFVIVRENTEGLYAARGGGNILRDEVASDTMILTRHGTTRIAQMAADICLQRQGAPEDGVRRVTIVDKANVIRSYAFFRQVADKVLEAYPQIEVEHIIVDAMTVHMLNRPGHFDVVVCENLLGDILSDLGAAMIGGLGVAPSAELGVSHGYFQGSHGSAPDIAGRGISNPVATILSAAMMLDWLAQRRGNPALARSAERIRNAVETVLADQQVRTPDLGGSASTQAFAGAIADTARQL